MSNDTKERILADQDWYWAIDAETYVDEVYPIVDGRIETPWVKCAIHNFSEIFKRGDIKGERLLDFSTGPSIISTISACKWFKSVTLSDYAPQNRAALVKWLRKDPGARDFSPYFKYICKLEGNEEDWRNREEHLRSSIDGILESDWTKDDVINPVPAQPYDCVFSSYTLEMSVFDAASLERALSNVNKVISPGGFLILACGFDFTFYMINGYKFKCFPTTKPFLEEMFQRCGFKVERWTIETPGLPNGDNDTLYFVTARKLKLSDIG